MKQKAFINFTIAMIRYLPGGFRNHIKRLIVCLLIMLNHSKRKEKA